ncbi:threonine/homoserine/homoserine lactone efflux protein [Arcticibacter pallidicorallinus]|uniref:Threonine/homoserine/homoserine lactone efflux protein n=1 Tax=Arcticibacter pallidicorallinus TaxID=1259464 RepID=A0A2T0U3K6_9SPHI|nr:LysE family translocator [Arcticibacter pallidicorallinus]PRY52448.1 threonine/homoserine/homoserine lactone efflux protein [Arcticibacter pallidicorallinus]
MLETIISGIGLGIVLSFATGPVFFALLKTSIEKGFHAGISLAGGVLMSDVIYVSLALYGSSFIQFENEYRYVIGLTGAAVMMGIGFFYLLKKVKINYDNITSTKRNTGYFFKGFLMCIFNPSLLIYWITVTSSIISVTGEIQAQQIFPFFGSILITQFSMDSVKAYYANKLRYKIKERTIVLLNRVAGSLIMIFALKLIYDLLS